MAVRTNDIALRDFSEDGFATSATDHLGDRVALFCSIPVVELHYIEGEAPPAIQTGNVAKFGQEIRVCLPVRALLFDSV
jgi:hypothetical protein